MQGRFGKQYSKGNVFGIAEFDRSYFDDCLFHTQSFPNIVI